MAIYQSTWSTILKVAVLWLVFLLISSTSASPLFAADDLCATSFGNLLCLRSSQHSSSVYIDPPTGQPTSNGVLRYSVRYASAERWASPVISTTWTPPNASNPTALPLACPQNGLDPSQSSEDCLDLVLYVPPTAKTTKGGIPTIVWVHGGSFIVGSATAPGLDGSNLAIATNAIVAVVQYRLGVLGLLPPASSAANSNLALQDLMTALTFLRTVLPFFGGSPATPQLTLAGQSSGASLVRALLGTPAAAPLFTSAWLHSDPLDYGFLTTGAISALRTAWVSELGCASGPGCAQNMSLSTLLAHQSSLLSNAPALGPEYFPFAPLRPSASPGVLISHTFTGPGTFPAYAAALKPLVVTTVKDEAAFTIFSAFPDSGGPVPSQAVASFINATIGPARTAQVTNSSFYSIGGNSSADARPMLETLGTDLVWRCSAWKLAREWAAHGAHKQYVGVFTHGVSYPGNAQVPECAQPGAVCHQDDIEVLFGTAESASTSTLTREVQARYAAFVRTGNPNARGYAKWKVTRASHVSPLDLGGKGLFPVGACVPAFWGQEVQFDYQVLNE